MNNYKKMTRQIISLYLVVPLLITGIMYKILPYILNYPPDSINNEFQKKIDGITYAQQYVVLIFIVIILSLIFLMINLKKIERNILSIQKKDKDKIEKGLKKLTKLCFNIPIKVYYAEIIIPLVVLPTILKLINADISAIIKISTLYTVFFILASVISYVFTQSKYNDIMTRLYKEYGEFFDKINNKNKTRGIKKISTKLIIQIFPLMCAAIFFIVFFTYNLTAKRTGDIYSDLYNKNLQRIMKTRYDTEDEMIKELKKIDKIDKSHRLFIIKEDRSIIYSEEELSKFFVEYTVEKSENQGGRTYDYYCIDATGTTFKVYINGQKYFVGIKYSIKADSTIMEIVYSGIILLFVILLILVYVIKALVRSIKKVTKNLDDINDNQEQINEYHLPVISNDEIGDLTIAFNKTQDLTKKNIEQIKANQKQLMEKERLASLRTNDWRYCT